MKRSRHKRKNNHVVIVTSDAADVGARQFRIRPWILQAIILILCVVIGTLIGYLSYEKNIWEKELAQIKEQKDAIYALEQEKAELMTQAETLEGQIDALEGQAADMQKEIVELNQNIGILNDTVAQKEQAAEQLAAELNKQFLPTIFPLTSGRATEEAPEGEEPICIFSVAEGSMVVATAAGTVVFVNEDPDYGYNIWVDHGNGYATIYKCRGDVKVKKGEMITQGAAMLVVTGQNSRLGYQIMKDNVYVEPMEMLEISG